MEKKKTWEKLGGQFYSGHSIFNRMFKRDYQNKVSPNVLLD